MEYLKNVGPDFFVIIIMIITITILTRIPAGLCGTELQATTPVRVSWNARHPNQRLPERRSMYPDPLRFTV